MFFFCGNILNLVRTKVFPGEEQRGKTHSLKCCLKFCFWSDEFQDASVVSIFEGVLNYGHTLKKKCSLKVFCRAVP